MAEMTAAEAIEELKPVWISHRGCHDTLEVVVSVEQGEQIAALIEQQAAEIERLKQANSELASAAIEKPPYKTELLQEIAKKDRMLKFIHDEYEGVLTLAEWLAWLGKEAEV